MAPLCCSQRAPSMMPDLCFLRQAAGLHGALEHHGKHGFAMMEKVVRQCKASLTGRKRRRLVCAKRRTNISHHRCHPRHLLPGPIAPQTPEPADKWVPGIKPRLSGLNLGVHQDLQCSPLKTALLARPDTDGATVNSPPPCGEGLGVGVPTEDRSLTGTTTRSACSNEKSLITPSFSPHP